MYYLCTLSMPIFLCGFVLFLFLLNQNLDCAFIAHIQNNANCHLGDDMRNNCMVFFLDDDEQLHILAKIE